MADITRVYITDPVRVGQSVQNGNTAGTSSTRPTVSIADMSPNGPNPATLLDGPNPQGGILITRFPSDTPPYYMVLAINKYSRASWNAVGQLNEESRIILPLPNQMIDNHNIRYDISDIGIAGAVGFDVMSGAMSQAAATVATGAAAAALGAAQNSLGTFGQVTGKAVRGALGAAGLAVNDFMTVMLKGPDYKRRDFVWRFSPKTAKETQALRRIIQLLNNSMAPALAGFGSAFFSWPKIFKPEFVYNGQQDLLALNTFRMKPSVVTDFNINYTPNGVFSPFASTKAPTSVEIHITFLELEFWLTGDFDDVPSNPNHTTSTDQWIQDSLKKFTNPNTNADNTNGVNQNGNSVGVKP